MEVGREGPCARLDGEFGGRWAYGETQVGELVVELALGVPPGRGESGEEEGKAGPWLGCCPEKRRAVGLKLGKDGEEASGEWKGLEKGSSSWSE